MKLKRFNSLVPTFLTIYLWIKGNNPLLPGFSCPIRMITNIPGPSCYLTRATSAALNGDFIQSITLHLFGPFFAFTLIVWSILSFKERILIPRIVTTKNIMCTILLLIFYWMIRLTLTYKLGINVFPDNK